MSPCTDELKLVALDKDDIEVVSAHVQDKRGLAGIVASMHGISNEKYDPSQLGIGIADMLIEKLLESGQFRLLEQKLVRLRLGFFEIFFGRRELSLRVL